MRCLLLGAAAAAGYVLRRTLTVPDLVPDLPDAFCGCCGEPYQETGAVDDYWCPPCRGHVLSVSEFPAPT